MTPWRRGLRGALARLALGALGLSAGFVLAELALRALPRSWSGESASENASPSWTPPGWEAGWRGSMRAHPILGLEHAAGVDLAVPLPSGGFRFRTNNLGLRRDEDITAAKPPGTVRILVVSYTHLTLPTIYSV